MANIFTTDILIQTPEPNSGASFYVEQLGFKITGQSPRLLSLHGDHINLFIERGPALGPVLEVMFRMSKKRSASLSRADAQSSKTSRMSRAAT